MGLVDEYRVAADLLERRALERLGGVFLLKRFELALELVAHALDLLDREVLLAGAVRKLQQPGFLELVDARLERRLLRPVGHLELFEAAEADDHRVPVARGGLPPEPAHRVGAFRRGVGEDEQLRVGVELEVVGGPLLGEVVRHDDHRLAGSPKALELVHGGDAGEGLAGADRVRDQRALAVLDDARHGVALVLPELDVGRHPRQRQVVAAVRARGDAVEFSVVDVGEHGRAVLVLPDPLAEGLLELAALGVGRGRGHRVGDLLLGLARGRVVVGVVLLDLDEAAVECGGEDHEAVVGAHAPLLRDRLVHAAAGGRDAPPAGHLGVADLEAARLGGGLVAAALPARIAVADLEGLEREVADHRRGDPGASELTGDLPGHELDRLDGLEARFKVLERRDAVRVGGLDGELGGLHEAAPVVAEALQALLGGELGQRRRGDGMPAALVVGATLWLEQVDFHHGLLGALFLLDAEQVLDGVRCRPEGPRDAHAVLDCRLPG